MNTFLSFEIRTWLRSPMTWIFFGVIALLAFFATATDSVSLGGSVGSVRKNAPSVVQQYYLIMSLLSLLMTTAFMSATAMRDISSGMYQFIFTSPIRKSSYFFGNFFGSALIATVPLLGVSFGTLLAPLMPWVTPERYGDVVWLGHLYGYLGFALPNTVLVAVWIYGLAVTFRSTMISFVGAIALLVLYGLSSTLTNDLSSEWLAAMLDPFGGSAFNLSTKYATVDEKNTTAVAITGVILSNRLLWLSIAALGLLGIYGRFSFSIRQSQRTSRSKTVASKKPDHVQPASPSSTSRITRLLYDIRHETKSVLRNQTFLIILVVGSINLIVTLLSIKGLYGNSVYPTTYSIISAIQNSFYAFLIGIITFYSGYVVWRERDARIADITDATPSGVIGRTAAKIIALIAAVLAVLVSTIAVGIVVQLCKGYTQIELDQYISRLLVFDLFGFAYLIVAAFLIHNVVNNRYIGYFAFVAFIVLNAFVWGPLDISTLMVQFGKTPQLQYSDMNGFGPYLKGELWFNAYWLASATVLFIVCAAFTVRGHATTWKQRLSEAGQRLRSMSVALLLCICAWIGIGAVVYNATMVQNTIISPDEMTELQLDYERTYKRHERLPQPQWTHFDYNIGVYPEERRLTVYVRSGLRNVHDVPISAVHFTLPSTMDSMKIDIPGAKLVHNDNRLDYRIYALAQPLNPGDSLPVTIATWYAAKAFENSLTFSQLTDNGTFFNNMDIMPAIGYQRANEIADKNERSKRGLPVRLRMTPLDSTNMSARRIPYLETSADFLPVRTVISTSVDQIAIAPGSLRRQWKEKGRSYFEYALDHPSMNFYSFLSARYAVARERWNGVDLEVYYNPEHGVNVPTMLKSMRKSLDYYTKAYGPYKHKQCRIIEFPRYATFAQAFPGTMPYSEGLGFVADLRDVRGDDIDYVFFVVAHEMAHQWWAHQVVGAAMQGSEMLSESFAEYCALMVMEREYGKDKMRKFLAYEMDEYLSGRGGEFEAERPLYRSENQSYIHYSKGSVALYYLKEMMGEENMNRAMRSLIETYAYRGAPYPTSAHAVEAFRAMAPSHVRGVVDDVLTTITIFDNRVTSVTAKQAGASWDVSIRARVEKKRADSLGNERTIPTNDIVDVGVFADDGTTPGKVLAMQRLRLQRADTTITIRVKEKPKRVGVDPYVMMIDRNPDDNLKDVQ